MPATTEARIILPNADNDGNSLAHIHDLLAVELCRTFGGFTSVASEGAWVDPETGTLYREPGTAYDVAGTSKDVAPLLRIAENAGRAAGQIATYVRDFTGSVHFLDTSPDSSSIAA